jgi:cytochrome bd-type quinol oxidase subunit 2
MASSWWRLSPTNVSMARRHDNSSIQMLIVFVIVIVIILFYFFWFRVACSNQP